jgi:hypothetical protein
MARDKGRDHVGASPEPGAHGGPTSLDEIVAPPHCGLRALKLVEAI